MGKIFSLMQHCQHRPQQEGRMRTKALCEVSPQMLRPATTMWIVSLGRHLCCKHT